MKFWPSLLPCLRGLCPHCASGKLFRHFFYLKDACTHCGLSFKAMDVGDGPVFFVLSILCVFGTPLALWQGMQSDWPMWLLVPFWAVLLTISTLLLLRPMRGFFVAAQYEKRISNPSLDQPPAPPPSSAN